MIVGIFVILGFCGFLFILFNINGGKGIFSREVTFFGTFKHVKGLNFGSEVSLAGFRVGTVSKVQIGDLKNKELIVEFTVTKEMVDKIREDSIAMIKTSGVLGDKYIEISLGSPESPQAKWGTFLKTEEPADLLSKTGDMMEDIGKNFKDNGQFSQLIQNLNQVSANLAVLTEDLKKANGAGNLGQSMGRLNSIMSKIDRGEGTLGALINDPTVYEDVKTLMGGAKRSSVLKYFMNSFMDSGSEANKTKK